MKRSFAKQTEHKHFQARLHEFLSHHERMKILFPDSRLPTPNFPLPIFQTDTMSKSSQTKKENLSSPRLPTPNSRLPIFKLGNSNESD